MEKIYLFGININSYSFFICLGIIIGVVLSYYICLKYKLIFEDYLIGFSYALLFGLLFAKILYFIVTWEKINWKLFFSNFLYFENLMKSGFVFYGGVFGAIVGIVLAQKIHKIKLNEILYAITPTFPLMHSFGRIGCHCAGCCFGIPVHFDVFSIKYENETHPLRNIPLFPVQLLESILNFLLFIILIFYLRKKGINIKLIYYYLLSYSILRFLLEFLRFDAVRGVFYNLSTSQYISILIFCYIAYKLYKCRKVKNKVITK